jgi:3-phenylpropionate/cinnamic acid dioxygenase small subunit
MEKHFECSQWLNAEAQIFDENRMQDWVALLHPEIEYCLPVRITRERDAGLGFSEASFHMYEDYGSLTTRVDRLDTDYAWSENPPSRTRRFVSNVRVSHAEGDALAVTSNLLVYRGRLDDPRHDLIVGERHDLLVPGPDGLQLRRRRILLDHATLPTKNLALFF